MHLTHALRHGVDTATLMDSRGRRRRIMDGEKEKYREVDGKDKVGRLLIGGIPHWRRPDLMPPILPGASTSPFH